MFESLSFTIRPFTHPLERRKGWLFPQESLGKKYFPTQWKWKLSLTSSSTSEMCPRHSKFDNPLCYSTTWSSLYSPSAPQKVLPTPSSIRALSDVIGKQGARACVLRGTNLPQERVQQLYVQQEHKTAKWTFFFLNNLLELSGIQTIIRISSQRILSHAHFPTIQVYFMFVNCSNFLKKHVWDWECSCF